jgi:hypothetical protein
MKATKSSRALTAGGGAASFTAGGSGTWRSRKHGFSARAGQAARGDAGYCAEMNRPAFGAD